MSKDPAVSWYWNDWAGGTQAMTREEKGAYMELLQAQHSRGSVPLNFIKKLFASDFDRLWPAISEKFQKDENGFFNSRLREEIAKRRAYSESRKKNREKKHEETEILHQNTQVTENEKNANNISYSYDKDMKTYDKHMGIGIGNNIDSSDSNSVSSISINRGMQGGMEIAPERPSHEWYAALYLRFVSAYGTTGRAIKRSSIEYALHSAVDDCIDQGKMNQNEAATFLSEQAKRCAELDAKAGNAKRLNPETWLNEKCYQSQIKPEAVPTEKTKQQAKQDEIRERQERVAREFFDKQKAKEAGNGN